MKRLYYGCLWLFLGAVCWTLCLAGWTAHGARFGGGVSYRGGQTAFDQLAELRRQIGETGFVTGWGQSLSVTVKAMALNESASVDVIWSDGDASRIWAPEIIIGQMPVEGDDIGCALDEKTALKLFGSIEILGLEVRVGGVDAVIRGVFALPEGIQALGVDPGRGLGFFPAALSADAQMSALEFSLSPNDGKSEKEAASDFMVSAGMDTSGAFDDHVDQSNLMRFLCGLPGDVLALTAVLQVLAIFLSLSRGRISALAALRQAIFAAARQKAWAVLLWIFEALVCGAVIFAAISLTAHSGRIPSTYLPTRWSDFSFWPGLLDELAQGGANARLSAALLPDMFGSRLHGLAAAFSLSAIALYLMALRNLRGFGGHSPLYITAAGLTVSAAPLFGLWLGNGLGWHVSALPIAVLLLPAAAFLLWIVPGDFRPTIDIYLPDAKRRYARSAKRAKGNQTPNSNLKGDYV